MAQKSYDWSKLPYSGISGPINRVGTPDSEEYSGGTAQFSPLVQLMGQSFDPTDFGKYGSFVQDNPGAEGEPTFTATRIKKDGTRQNDNQYETTQFKVQTDPDGKQYLVPAGDWTPTNRDSGGAVQDFLKFAAVAAGGWLATGGLAGLTGAGAGVGAGATAATGATNAALIESALGTAGYGASSAGLGGVAAGTAAGAGALDAGLLGPSSLGGAVEPLALTGQAPVAGGFASTGGLPTLADAGLGGAAGVTGATGSGATNPALIESAVGTPGYGASSAGVGGGAGELASAGFLDKAKAAWSALTPAQQLQLGGSLGSAIAGGFGGNGGSGSGGTGQAGAGQLQLDLANQLRGIGTAELGKAGERQAVFDPKFNQYIDAALASQTTNDARSADVWKTYTDTFLPAQQRMAQQAADYSSTARRDAAAAEAVAGVDTQFQRNRETQQRDLGRAGVSMTSGRALTLDAAQRFAQAKASAGADRTARQGIEDRGIALTQNVAAMANPTAGLSLDAARTGLSAGANANAGLSTQQGTYNASLAPGLNALTGAVGAAGGAGNTFNGVANTDQRQQSIDNQGYAGLGSLVGTLGGMFFQSDPKTKTVRGKVSSRKALKSLEDAEVYDWKYKRGQGDGKRHQGRMAGKGDPHGGKAIDAISEFGKHHAAIKELSKQVKRMSLADAKGGR